MTGDSIQESIQDLGSNPALRKAVEEQIDDGLLGRLGIDLPRPAPGRSPLESFERRGDDALEAIIRRVGRPPLLVRNDRVEILARSLVDFPAGTDTRIVGTERVIPSVGRVEFVNFRMPWGGTGWVFEAEGRDRIVVTNRHVASLVARRTAGGKGVFLKDASLLPFGARIDFAEEVDSPAGDARTFEVVDIPYIADTTAPDVALLRVTGPKLPTPLPLARAEARKGDLVAIIGYPAFDERNEQQAMARYFRDLYDVKRYAPGRVMQALSATTVFRHDCTTLGGNSGSPVIRLSDGKVVGLHFSGVFGVANSAVGVTTLRAILAGRRPVAVRLGGGEGAAESAGDGVHQPDDLLDRSGYDPTFLGRGGLKAPWPGVPAARRRDLATPSDARRGRPNEIRYTHFGVLFSTSRRQPLMTAVNIDGLHRVQIKRGRDKWFRDARIPLDDQLTRADYADLDIDRGHMVRREDPNWDPDLAAGNPDGTVTELAEQANLDTFHYTNAAVQHGDFNSGSALWLGLEDLILKSAKTHGFRASVFTGPVVREDDDEIGPGVFAPREFWKLVAMEDADRGKLHATAYLLSQGQLIHDLLAARSRPESAEGFVLGAYRTYQIAVADLAEATGYDLSAYTAADPLAATADGREATATGEPLYLPLDRPTQLIL